MTPEEIEKSAERCFAIIKKLCAENRAPRRSIPARPDHDEDIILYSEVCRLRDEIYALRQSKAVDLRVVINELRDVVRGLKDTQTAISKTGGMP